MGLITLDDDKKALLRNGLKKFYAALNEGGERKTEIMELRSCIQELRNEGINLNTRIRVDGTQSEEFGSVGWVTREACSCCDTKLVKLLIEEGIKFHSSDFDDTSEEIRKLLLSSGVMMSVEEFEKLVIPEYPLREIDYSEGLVKVGIGWRQVRLGAFRLHVDEFLGSPSKSKSYPRPSYATVCVYSQHGIRVTYSPYGYVEQMHFTDGNNHFGVIEGEPEISAFRGKFPGGIEFGDSPETIVSKILGKPFDTTEYKGKRRKLKGLLRREGKNYDIGKYKGKICWLTLRWNTADPGTGITYQFGDDERLCMVDVPGKSASGFVEEMLDSYDEIYL